MFSYFLVVTFISINYLPYLMGLVRRTMLAASAILHPVKASNVAASLVGQPQIRQADDALGGRMFIILPEQSSVLLYMGQLIEPDVTVFLKEVLEPGMVFFDVGASIGYHSVTASEIVGETGKVVSFEPMRNVYEVLKLNSQLHPNITPEQFAVNGQGVDYMELQYFGVRHSELSTSFESPRTHRKLPKPEIVTVKSVSLDEYVERNNISPDVIKIDIEGGEMGALIGASQIIREYRPAIIFEGGDIGRIHENRTRACIDYLVKFGYTFRAHDSKFKQSAPHAPRDSYAGCFNILALPGR